MKKEIINRKIELFKQHFPDYKILDSGALYVTICHVVVVNWGIHTISTITKNTKQKLGEKFVYPTTSCHLGLLLTTSGVLKIGVNLGHGVKWKSATIQNITKFLEFNISDRYVYSWDEFLEKKQKLISDVKQFPDGFVGAVFYCTPSGSQLKRFGSQVILSAVDKALDILLIGRKYEWIKNYPNLHSVRLFQQFESLAELKSFFNLPSQSDDEFFRLCKFEELGINSKVSSANNRLKKLVMAPDEEHAILSLVRSELVGQKQSMEAVQSSYIQPPF